VMGPSSKSLLEMVLEMSRDAVKSPARKGNALWFGALIVHQTVPLKGAVGKMLPVAQLRERRGAEGPLVLPDREVPLLGGGWGPA